MMDRRLLLGAMGALLARTSDAQPAAAKPNVAKSRNPIFTHDLPDLNLKGWSVTAVEVVYEPGKGSGAHRHPGITIAYVLEGEISSKVGDGPEKIYKAGEMFLETPGELHGVSRNASATKPARLLAILLAEKGKQLTTPA